MRKIEKVGLSLFSIGMFVFCTSFLVLLMGIVGHIETHYTMKCKVIEIENNIVTLEDPAGYCWEVENETLYLDETYTVTFFTNGTDNTRLDDEIKKISIDK